MSNILNYTSSSIPSIINDPFSKSKIIAINMHMSKKVFNDGFYFVGSVEFKNGNTEGKQKFEKESFDDLYLSISEFVKSL